MDTKKFNAHLDELYTNKKSRNFVNHLIRAYFPISNVQKVWETPKRGFTCSLTNKSLSSGNDLLNEITKENDKQSLLKYLYLEMTDNNQAEVHPIEKILNNKPLALTGTDTTTYLSHAAYREFYKWLVNKIFNGDKHINWLIKNMRSEEMINTLDTSDQPEQTKNNIKLLKKSIKPAKKATLGDLKVLQELKAKMDGEG